MPLLKLTRRSIAEMPTPTSRPFDTYRDTEHKGFGLRNMKSGIKTFYVFYRPGGGGRKVSETAAPIGRLGVLTVEQARDRAARHRCSGDGNLAAGKTRCAAAPLRPRQPVHQRAVPAADYRSRRRLLDQVAITAISAKRRQEQQSIPPSIWLLFSAARVRLQIHGDVRIRCLLPKGRSRLRLRSPR
jgi:Arm DNA-binding domain